MVSGAVRTFAQLSEAGVVEALAALRESHVDEKYLRRVIQMSDGSFALGIRVPMRSKRDLSHPEKPWIQPFSDGLSFNTEFQALPLAAMTLADPDSGEAEMARREKLHAEHLERERQQAARDEEREKQRREAVVADQQAEAKARERFGGSRWDRLSPLAQALYAVALVYEDHGQPAVAEGYREVAREAGKGVVSFPRRRWDAPPREGDEASDGPILRSVG